MDPNASILDAFDRELYTPPPPDPVVDSWDQGKHRYFRVADGNGVLETKLDELREAGVRVVDFARQSDWRGSFWTIKTMIPRE